MERLTNKKEADAQRKSYEHRLKQGYPRNIPEERFLKLAAYEDAKEEGRWVALPPKTQDVDFMRIFELITADGEGRVIILPCKIGDKVYINTPNGATLCEVIYSITKPEFRTKTLDGLRGLDFSFHDYGKTVFLTHEEAEAALKGAKTDG